MDLDVIGHARRALETGRARIERVPFPHLVVDDVLPPAVYAALERVFPDATYVAETDEPDENRTYLRTSDRILADQSILPLWRSFVEANTAPAVLDHALAIWRADIERHHPDLEENFGKPMDAFDTGRRSGKGDSESNRQADVMIDCQFGVNTPVRKLGSPRGPHVDRGAKLFSALLHFRDEKDASTGGEYELFELRRGPFPKRHMKKIPHRYLRSVKRVGYRTNRLVMWINTPEAIHAVAARSITPYPRRYIAISGECFGGSQPSGYFSHFEAWDRPLGRLRAAVGLV